MNEQISLAAVLIAFMICAFGVIKCAQDKTIGAVEQSLQQAITGGER